MHGTPSPVYTRPQTSGESAAAKRSVLIVETNEYDAELARRALDDQGAKFQIEVARDARAGLERMLSAPANLILLGSEDKAGATELLTNLKARDQLRRIPVVVLAEAADDDEPALWYDLGAAAVVRKPKGLTFYRDLMGLLDRFWLKHVQLPHAGSQAVATSAPELTLSDLVRGLDLCREMLFSISLDGRLQSLEGAWEKCLALDPSELTGRDLVELAHPVDRAAVAGALAELRAGRQVSDMISRFGVEDGRWRSIEWSAAGAPGKQVAYGTARDITEAQSRAEAQRQRMTGHDPMTGLYTRHRFEQDLERELARSLRYRGHGALLTIDLDNVRRVNDTLGHVAGDELIAHAASVIRRRLRGTDMIGRLGDDEFGVILLDVGVDEAVAVAHSLLSALRSPVDGALPLGAVDVTASIGVAAFEVGVPISAEMLIVKSDMALIDAKQAGRDCVAVFERGRVTMVAEPTGSQQPAPDTTGVVLEAKTTHPSAHGRPEPR
jgi:diguanylate cyclase (GGDEF)-like protein/PAS domain S-box-containing protein